MTDHLHALAMRTKAAELCSLAGKKRSDQIRNDESKDPAQIARWRAGALQAAMNADDIRELPLEADHAALLAEAVKLPEIAALVDFVNADRELRMIGILNATEDHMKTLISARQKAHDTIAALETP